MPRSATTRLVVAWRARRAGQSSSSTGTSQTARPLGSSSGQSAAGVTGDPASSQAPTNALPTSKSPETTLTAAPQARCAATQRIRHGENPRVVEVTHEPRRAIGAVHSAGPPCPKGVSPEHGQPSASNEANPSEQPGTLPK